MNCGFLNSVTPIIGSLSNLSRYGKATHVIVIKASFFCNFKYHSLEYYFKLILCSNK